MTIVAPSEIEGLRLAMRRTAGAVSIVTAGIGAERTGMTVTSALSLSMQPPTMLVCIDRAASSWPVIRQAGHFAVNIPSSKQVAVAERFAGRGGLKGAARYGGAEWFELESGTLGLVNALAVIDCAVEEALDRHSHTIVIGRVLSTHLGEDVEAPPLVYVDGGFTSVKPGPAS